MTNYRERFTTALACLLTAVTLQAQVRYEFNPQDYTSTDAARAPQSAFSYADASFTVAASGQNNVAFMMGSACDNKYYITGQDHWFVVAATGVKTGAADAYLWWSNGVNHNTQVVPDYIITDGDRQLFIWDAEGGNALFSWFNASASQMVLNSGGRQFILAMGLTATGTAGTITDVNYYSDATLAAAYPATVEPLALAQNTDPVVSYERTADGLLAHRDNLSVRIRLLSDGNVRVTKFLGDEAKVEKSLVIQALNDLPFNDFEVSEADGVVTLTTSKAKVLYNLSEASVSVLRATGETLISESDATLRPTTDGPNASFRLKQSFRLDANEDIYGFGQLQNGRLSMRGVTMNMIQDNRSIYIPYFYSTKRYALYWDNYSPTSFTDTPDATTFASTGQAIDYYVLVGDNSEDVLRQWRHLTGGTQLPPIWNFGLYQSKQRYMSAQEVIDIVSKYRADQVPLDCVVQDWQYWGDDNHWNAMEFLNPNYTDYQRMIDEVHAMNAKLMISVWPDFGPQTAQYAEFGGAGRLIPIQSYPTNVATRPYDCYDAQTRDRYWQYLYTGLMSKGIDALWLDSAEPDDFSNKGSDYDYVTGLDGRTFRSVRNAFPLAHVEGVYDHHLAEPSLNNKRVSILTRSAFAGMQRTGAFVWSADITSSWECLAAQIPAACNFSVSGLPYWNSDTGAFFIGGYNGGVTNPDWRRLYTRWTQFSCFCPMMRFHGDQTPREIWQFGAKDDAQGDYNNILRYIRLRYRLLPYIYSTAHDVVKNDATFMTAMPVAFEDDAACRPITDQYMFGRNILVAPVVQDRVAGRNVYLPQSLTWYDFWTGEAFNGGKSVFRSTPQDIMPLYIPAGTILPFGPEVQYSSEKAWDDLEIRVYAGADGSFTLYEDELDGYGYKNGASTEIPFTWNEQTQTLTIGARTGSFPGMLQQRQFRIVKVSTENGFGDQPAARIDQTVSYDGSEVSVALLGTLSAEVTTYDCTSLIQNPSFEADGRTLTKQAPQGWTVESATTWWGVNVGAGGNDPQATDGQYVFGVWDGSATMQPAIYQTLSGLPVGHYTLSVDMQASNRSAATVRLGKQYVFAGEAKSYFKDAVSTAGVGDAYPMQTFSVSFDVTEPDASLRIGVSTEGAPAETWFKIDNFRLTRTAVLALDEDKAADIDASEQGVRVSLHRTFLPNQWNTLVLPFSMTQPQVLATFGTDAQVAKMTAADADGVAFSTTTDGIEANTPVLLRTSTEQTDYLFNGVDVVQGEPLQELSGISFRGNYDGLRAVGAGCYFVYNDHMMRSTEKTTMRSFRAFFEVDEALVKADFGLTVDGTPTRIEATRERENSKLSSHTYFDLAGRQLSSSPAFREPSHLKKGIYVVTQGSDKNETRKIMVK